MQIKKIICMILGLIIVTALNVSNATCCEIEKIDINDFPKNSMERFVASKAIQEGISYDEALEKHLEKQKTLRVPEKTIKYKTVDIRTTGGIRTNTGNYDVYIASEIEYEYNNFEHRPESIIDVGSPFAYIPGVSDCELQHGDYNVSNNKYSARISVTGAFQFTCDRSTTVSFDIVAISGTVHKTATTRAKTFVANIELEDL